MRPLGSTTCITVDEYLGGARLAHAAEAVGATETGSSAKPKTGGKKANAAAAAAAAAAKADASGSEQQYPEPSLAQARQAVVASCILPLGGFDTLRRWVRAGVGVCREFPPTLLTPRCWLALQAAVAL